MPDEPKPEAKPPAKKTAPAGWNLRDLKLPPDEMVEAIQSAQNVPDEWKAALIVSVNAINPRPRFLRLDAHCHFSGAQMILTASLSPF